MIYLLKQAILVIACTLCFSPVKAQSLQEIEGKALYYLQKIEKFDTSPIDFDSLASANKQLFNYLERTLAHSSSTLKYSFAELKESRLVIRTSDDGKLRIYFWEVGGGGTSRSHNVLAQYETNGKTHIQVLNDFSKASEFDLTSGSIYFDLNTYHTKNRGTLYTVTTHDVAWSAFGSFAVNGYSLQNGKLSKTAIFDNKKKHLNDIGYSYDLRLDARSNPKDYPKPVYSNDKKTLFVPLTKKNGAVTSSFQEYRFDGNNFVYKGITTL